MDKEFGKFSSFSESGVAVFGEWCRMVLNFDAKLLARCATFRKDYRERNLNFYIHETLSELQSIIFLTVTFL